MINKYILFTSYLLSCTGIGAKLKSKNIHSPGTLSQVRQVAGAAHLEPLPDQRQPPHPRHQRLRQLPHLLLHRDQVQRSANILAMIWPSHCTYIVYHLWFDLKYKCVDHPIFTTNDGTVLTTE